jgi:hypothetical protein
MPTRSLVLLCLLAVTATGCLAKFTLHSAYQPAATPGTALASIAPARVAMLEPEDRRTASKQIGHFDPNNLDLLTPFETEKPEEQEIAADVAKLLAANGIAIDPAAPVGLRVAMKQYLMSGRRRFDDTTFSAALAFDLEVIRGDAENPVYVGAYDGRADTRGTETGSQDRYFNAALTNATDRAMRKVAADAKLAAALAGRPVPSP